jgi:hypothetical protein
MSYGIFLFDPDGDMGEGIIVMSFHNAETADKKAEQITKAAGLDDGRDTVVCLVVPIYRASIKPDLAVETMREH